MGRLRLSVSSLATIRPESKLNACYRFVLAIYSASLSLGARLRRAAGRRPHMTSLSSWCAYALSAIRGCDEDAACQDDRIDGVFIRGVAFRLEDRPAVGEGIRSVSSVGSRLVREQQWDC